MESLIRVLAWVSISGAGFISPTLSVAEIEPEAARIFAAYADFLGGEEAFENIESGRMRMEMEMPGLGMNMERTVTFQVPDKVHVDVDIQGYGKMRQGYDGEVGWSIDPVQGRRELRGKELEKLLEETDFKDGLRLADKYASAKVVGNSEDGLTIVECVKSDSGLAETLYFEKTTGLLRRSDYTEDLGPQGMVPVSARVESYEKVGNIRLPMETRAEMMGTEMRVVITSFEPNVEVDGSIFRMPD